MAWDESENQSITKEFSNFFFMKCCRSEKVLQEGFKLLSLCPKKYEIKTLRKIQQYISWQ